MSRSGTLAPSLLTYGLTHALVDATCAAAVFSLLRIDQLGLRTFFGLVVLYDTLAFALQAPFGALLDRLHLMKLLAMAGCLLTAISLLCLRQPYLAIGLAGIGNALFHVGGGAFSLGLAPQKAAIPGLFVAPGALGLCLGTLLGQSAQAPVWPLGALLLAAIMAIALVGSTCPTVAPASRKLSVLPVILLLLLSIVIRSLVGLALSFSWKADLRLLLLLTTAVFCGKAAGGILGDRLGWLGTSLAGLALAAPLLAFGSGYPYLAIPGIFLFNLTMPVTLTAIADLLPGQAGFAFGLTTLALVTGAYPTFTAWQQPLGGRWATLALVAVSIAAVFFGLKLYFSICPDKSKDAGTGFGVIV